MGMALRNRGSVPRKAIPTHRATTDIPMKPVATRIRYANWDAECKPTALQPIARAAKAITMAAMNRASVPA